jgi:hypothetical protein
MTAPAFDPLAEVIAAQFAAGLTIRRLAREWGVDEDAVEAAIREQYRQLIPRWAGGLKPTRDEQRRARRMDEEPGSEGAGTPWLPMISDL